MCECKTHCGLLFNHRVEFYQTQNIYKGYIGTQKDHTQVTTLNIKVWGSAAKLNRTSGKSFGCEIVNCEQWQTVLRNSACN